MKSDKSLTIERNKQGTAVALVIAGRSYTFTRRGFEMPEETAAVIFLADITPDITIDFVEKHERGVVFRAIQNMKSDHGEVVVMVRHTLGDWTSPLRLGAYANAVESLVKNRERLRKDVTHLVTHDIPEEALIVFVAKVSGTSVDGLLKNARKMAEEIIAPAKELEERTTAQLRILMGSAAKVSEGSKQTAKPPRIQRKK